MLPNLRQYADQLAGQDIFVALFLLGAGLVFMLAGFRIFKGLIALSFGAIGFALGSSLFLDTAPAVAAGVVTAIALAVLSWYLIKIAVAVLGGAWCGVAAMTVLGLFPLRDEMLWIGGVVGLAGGFAMAFILYYELIALVTSMEGALLFIAGLLALTGQNASLSMHLRQLLIDSPVFGLFAVIAGTLTGFLWQLGDLRKGPPTENAGPPIDPYTSKPKT